MGAIGKFVLDGQYKLDEAWNNVQKAKRRSIWHPRSD